MSQRSKFYLCLCISAVFAASWAVTPATQDLVPRIPQRGPVAMAKGQAVQQSAANAMPWNQTSMYTASSVVTHGEFEGNKMYWTNAWWTDGADEPGQFADSGGTSAWGLINSKSFGDGTAIQWTGWNSNAGKWEVTHDVSWVFTETQVGNWGDQIDKKGPGAYLPTWRDGAEGCYTIIHDDIGALPYLTSVKPGVDVDLEHPRIDAAWAMKVDVMNEEQWAATRDMVMAGIEITNHSWDHTSAADQWQWHYMGTTLPATDPALPKEIRNLEVGTPYESYKPLTVQVPYVEYENGDVTKPKILYNTVTFEVSNDYQYKVDSVYNAEWGEYEYSYASTGKIKPAHKGWSDAANANVDMLKVYCVPGWTASRQKANVDVATSVINANIYEKINSPHFKPGKRCEYYCYPYDAYSSKTHDALFAAGLIAARGGAKSGTPLPPDFYHPFRIDFDAFYMIDAKAESVFPNNPHQRISLAGLVDRVWKTKGYMVRELHACADVANWNDANDQTKGGWWGGIPKSLYKEHYLYLEELIDQHKITVETPSEAIKYRLTANSVTGVSINGNEITATTGGSLSSKYQDEISVIVVLGQGYSKMGAKYKDNDFPRIAPRKMNNNGTAWSISMNPYYNGGKITLTPDVEIATIRGAAAPAVRNAAQVLSMSRNAVTCRLPQGTHDLAIYSLDGKLVARQTLSGSGSVMVANLGTQLSRGMYVCSIAQKGAQAVRTTVAVR